MCKHNNGNNETTKTSFPVPFLCIIIISFIAAIVLLALFIGIGIVGGHNTNEIVLCVLIVSCAAVAITVVICLTVLICLTMKCLYKKDEKTDGCVKILRETYETVFNKRKTDDDTPPQPTSSPLPKNE